MEKIYMEDNQNRSSRQRKSLTGSVVLSFVVAIFAIFSLVVCGISQVSYAINPDDVLSFDFYVGRFDNNDQMFIRAENGSNTFSIPLLYSDAAFKNPVFCVEKHAGISTEVPKYNKGGEIEKDPYGFGLLYILNNSFATNASGFLSDSTIPDEVKIWATQAAIWLYLDEMHSSDSDYETHKVKDTEKAVLQGGVITFYKYDGKSKADQIYKGDISNVVNTLVKQARDYNSFQPGNIRISNQPSSFTQSVDKSFYQSEIVTIESSNSTLDSFTVTLSGIDTAYIVGEDGNKLEGSLAKGTSFYIRIPSESVTEEVQKLNVHIDAKFSMLSGYYYTSGDLQKVVTVTDKTFSVPAEFELEIIGAPDTGMTTAQTIYFIGLIVLLCGVGIVYANAKPVESKQ